MAGSGSASKRADSPGGRHRFSNEAPKAGIGPSMNHLQQNQNVMHNSNAMNGCNNGKERALADDDEGAAWGRGSDRWNGGSWSSAGESDWEKAGWQPFRPWYDWLANRMLQSRSPLPTRSPSSSISPYSSPAPNPSPHPSGVRACVIRLYRHSTRNPRSRSITALIVLLLLGLCFSLGPVSTGLRLDPTIDPRTFQLLPPGDPSGRIPTSDADAPLVAALAADRAERQALWESGGSEAWYKGDEGLRANRPASRFACDNGREGRPKGSLLFLAVFTHPGGIAKRQLLRTLLKPDLPPHGDSAHEPPLIDFAFISARPPNDDWRYLLEQEKALYGDVEWLESTTENIDSGKTAEFFKWAASGAGGRWNITGEGPEAKRENMEVRANRGEGGEGRDPRNTFGRGRPQFIMKTDDDSFLVVPNLLKEFKALDCSKLVYFGTSQGSWPTFSPYFRGLGYALSWPLVEWIGTSGMSIASALGIEDARVGAWLTELDKKVDRVQWVDVGWRMGDWDQMEIDHETVGLHWLKLDEWAPMGKRKILAAWKKAGRDYRWDYHLRARPPTIAPPRPPERPPSDLHNTHVEQRG